MKKIGLVASIIAVYTAVAIIAGWLGQIFGRWVGQKIIELENEEKSHIEHGCNPDVPTLGYTSFIGNV